VDLDPDPNWGSGSRKAKIIHKKEESKEIFFLIIFRNLCSPGAPQWVPLPPALVSAPVNGILDTGTVHSLETLF
jgi:hypothetical protein